MLCKVMRVAAALTLVITRTPDRVPEYHRLIGDISRVDVHENVFDTWLKNAQYLGV
jgi:hypothetical protein